VSGEPLEDKSVFTDYEGRRIYFCCEKCVGAFGENPQKYLDKMNVATKADDAMKMKEKNDGHDHDHH